MQTSPSRTRIALAAGMSLVMLALASCQGRPEPAVAPAAAAVSTPLALAAAGEPVGAAGPAATLAPVDTVAATATVEPTSTPLPAATPTDTPTAAPTETPTAAPTETPTETPTPEPVVALQPVQLTSGGCCTQPFWTADSQQIRFIDKPSPDAPVGIYGVSIAEPLAPPVLITERLANSLAVGDYLVETTENETFVERLSDGQRWTVPANGRSIQISPDRTRIAWSVNNNDLPPEQRVAALWIANIDGSNAQQIATLPRGGLSGWISNDILLINRRDNLQSRETILSTLSLTDGSTQELVRAEGLRSMTLSPTGAWLAYYATFNPDPAQNGFWLARTDGSQRYEVDPGLFGSYQWRGCPGQCAPEDERLLIVPLKVDAAFHELWQLNPSTGEATQLTDPAITPFKIANVDWRVSPDGRAIVFVDRSDRNIWVMQLP